MYLRGVCTHPVLTQLLPSGVLIRAQMQTHVPWDSGVITSPFHLSPSSDQYAGDHQGTANLNNGNNNWQDSLFLFVAIFFFFWLLSVWRRDRSTDRRRVDRRAGGRSAQNKQKNTTKLKSQTHSFYISEVLTWEGAEYCVWSQNKKYILYNLYLVFSSWQRQI